MKNTDIIIILLLFTIHSFGQNYYIVDSITKEKISLANIKNLSNDTGVYSDLNGKFSKSFFNLSDSIQISHINYEKLIIKIDDIKDTIFLIPKINTLEEIIITNKKGKKKNIGYIKNKKILSWFIQPKTELVTLIQYSKRYQSSIIKKIFIPIGKSVIVEKNGTFKKEKPNFNSAFKVHLYSNVSNKPKKEILNKPIIVNCSNLSKDIIEIDVSDQFIELPKEGVFVGVEMIGKINKGGELIKNKNIETILPSFKYTKRRKKYIQSISFVKHIFSNKGWINFKESEKLKHISKYNMGIGLELLIYEN